MTLLHTTYGVLAALLGLPGSAQPLGNYLANNPVMNAHRFLKNNGSVAKGFRWMDSTDQRNVVELLTSEGVRYAPKGLADQSQCLDADALAALMMAKLPTTNRWGLGRPGHPNPNDLRSTSD